MSKRNFYILVFMLMISVAQAQSDTATVYAFRQRTTGGMQKQGDIDESGKIIKRTPKQVFKHTIYLASASKARIYPVQIWINGKAFSVKSEPVKNNPVVPANMDAPVTKLKTLLPTTAGTVLKLTPLPLAADKSGAHAKALAVDNDVVVLYKLSGKLRYGVWKKFVELDPVALQ